MTLGSLALTSLVLGQFTMIDALSSLAKVFAEKAEEAQAEKKTYAEQLERAEGDNIFKYILLINVAALEGYVAQTRIQAEQSFGLARRVALIGFVMLGVGIARLST